MTDYTEAFMDSPTGARLRYFTCDAGKGTKAVLHISHGMSEYSGRYERFARALAAAGYSTIAHDHRGHGKTEATDAPLGMFGKTNGWQKVLQDMNAVNGHARTLFPDRPICLFGHSMGTIIGLNYCIHHSDKLDAAALWNSGVDGGPLLMIYGLLLRIERMFKGSDVESRIANKLAFDAWNKKFAPNRTASDWLSRDEAEVDNYIADPLCGFDATNSLWDDLLIGIKTGANDTELAKIRNGLPIHLLAGGMDPCTDNGKAVQRLHDRMKKTGINDLGCTILPDTRHESLNEVNRDETTANFINWLDQRFGK